MSDGISQMCCQYNDESLRSVNALVGVTIIRIQTAIIPQGSDQTSAINFKPFQDQEKNSKHLCTVIIIWDCFCMRIMVDRTKENPKTDQQSYVKILSANKRLSL